MNMRCGALWVTGLWLVLAIPQIRAQSSEQKTVGEQEKADQAQRRQRTRQGRRRADDAPKVGDVAPVFKLKSLDGESETNIADFTGKKPVVLLFGSYT